MAKNKTRLNGNQQLTGIKPYIYYSREYKLSNDSQFVITYTLDNYIEIQGTINGEPVYDHGYIIDVDQTTYSGGNITSERGFNERTGGIVTKYRNFDIDSNEQLTEYIDSNGTKNGDDYVRHNQIGNNIYKYVKVNGVKYYLDEHYKKDDESEEETRVFSFLKNQREYLSANSSANFIIAHPFEPNNSAQNFYAEAYEFTHRVIDSDKYNLSNLTSKNATDWDSLIRTSQTYSGGNIKVGGQANYKIFQDITNIEYYNSDFNQERRAVIKYAIEKNLRTAIANFNNYTDSTNNFQMPNLKEDEWDKIINNIGIISFLQGVQVGVKSYNGYAIVPNKKNEEFVAEDSIYITTTDGEYHRVNDDYLISNSNKIKAGEFNMNFERKSVLGDNGESMRLFYPHTETGSYSSIVTQVGINELVNNNEIPITIYEYLDEKGIPILGTKYYTALGRERKSIYRVINDVETYTN